MIVILSGSAQCNRRTASFWNAQLVSIWNAGDWSQFGTRCLFLLVLYLLVLFFFWCFFDAAFSSCVFLLVFLVGVLCSSGVFLLLVLFLLLFCWCFFFCFFGCMFLIVFVFFWWCFFSSGGFSKLFCSSGVFLNDVLSVPCFIPKHTFCKPRRGNI